ncbi:hypothetical protein KSS87_014815 [Heliosperma pusillum]|nr:hypothetical protein KSS87_014815 [Heliosperma pusillum]
MVLNLLVRRLTRYFHPEIVPDRLKEDEDDESDTKEPGDEEEDKEELRGGTKVVIGDGGAGFWYRGKASSGSWWLGKVISVLDLLFCSDAAAFMDSWNMGEQAMRIIIKGGMKAKTRKMEEIGALWWLWRGSKAADPFTHVTLAGALETLLEHLQQQVINPSSTLSDILKMMAAKALSNKQATVSLSASSSSMGVIPNNGAHDSPTNGNLRIAHLGVVGRGVKRVVLSSVGPESSSTKRPALKMEKATLMQAILLEHLHILELTLLAYFP